MALAAYAKERLEARGLELVFPERATFKEFAVRTGRPATEAIRAARAHGRQPRLPARPRLRRPRRRAARRRHRAPHRRRRSTGSSRRCGMKLIYEKSQAGRRGARRAAAATCRCPRVPAELARQRAAAAARARRARGAAPLHRSSRRATSASTRASIRSARCTMKYNPRVNERLVGAARLRATCTRSPRTTRRRARSSSSGDLQEILREVTGLDAVSASSRPRAARAS